MLALPPNAGEVELPGPVPAAWHSPVTDQSAQADFATFQRRFQPLGTRTASCVVAESAPHPFSRPRPDSGPPYFPGPSSASSPSARMASAARCRHSAPVQPQSKRSYQGGPGCGGAVKS